MKEICPWEKACRNVACKPKPHALHGKRLEVTASSLPGKCHCSRCQLQRGSLSDKEVSCSTSSVIFPGRGSWCTLSSVLCLGYLASSVPYPRVCQGQTFCWGQSLLPAAPDTKPLTQQPSLDRSLRLIVMMGPSNSCGIVCNVSLHHSNYSGERMMSGLWHSE